MCSSFGFAFFRYGWPFFLEKKGRKENLRPDFLALDRLQENRAREGTRLLALERRGGGAARMRG
jgi:hypothetical protein